MQILLQFELIQQAGSLWTDATKAQFLDAIEAGTLPREAFHRWLAQDYLFAKGLTSAQAVQAARTPRPAQQILIEGLGAMNAELSWFETHMTQRGLELDVEPNPVCQRYVDFLIASAYEKPPEVLMAMLFGVEAAYLAAWSSLSQHGPYEEFIQRWSNDLFQNYVIALGEWTHSMSHPEAQEAFNLVLAHERDFWSMTWDGE